RVISVNDLRRGLTIRLDDGVYSVVDFLHVKPGKGAAFVRTTLKNVRTGNVVERTFRAGERVERAHIETREMQYLYASGDEHVFMDTETYEQVTLTSEQLGDAPKYIKENDHIHIQFYEGQIGRATCRDIVSGYYFFTHYSGDLKSFLKRQYKSRFKTLVIPYLIWNIITVIAILSKNKIFVFMGLQYDEIYPGIMSSNLYKILWDTFC